MKAWWELCRLYWSDWPRGHKFVFAWHAWQDTREHRHRAFDRITVILCVVVWVTFFIVLWGGWTL